MRNQSRVSRRGRSLGPGSSPDKGGAKALELNDEWRGWIAENLLLGAARSTIIGHLVAKGCPIPLARQEVVRAEASPYLRGAAVLRQRLAKRDWLLACRSRLEMLAEGGAELSRYDALPADRFFRDHYAAHRPAIISGLIEHWPARHCWSPAYFGKLLGDPVIEVQTGRESDPAYEQKSTEHKSLMRLTKILALLKAEGATNDFYVTANNNAHNRAALAPLWNDIESIPNYLDPTSDRDGFFWMGPQGTITPWHHDLTNNLLVQICGRKRVTLVSSMQTPLMRNHLHCYSMLPDLSSLNSLPETERPKISTCIIEPGDVIFIPVGWWHFVEGLDVTVSMSFTNFVWDNDFSSSYTCYGQL